MAGKEQAVHTAMRAPHKTQLLARQWGSLKIEYHGRCSSIVDKILQLRPSRIQWQRDSNATRLPYAPLRDNPRKAWCHKKRHPLFLQVFPPSKKRGSRPRRRMQQIVVGESPLRINDGCACPMALGIGNEWDTADHTQTLRRFERGFPTIRAWSRPFIGHAPESTQRQAPLFYGLWSRVDR